MDGHLAFELFEQLGENHNRSLLLFNWALGGLN
jgi:Leucine-rich repeat (LRR) protein